MSGPGPPVRIGRNRSGVRPCFPDHSAAFRNDGCEFFEYPDADRTDRRGHHDAGPTNGAGLKVPMAITVIRRFPIAPVIASHKRRPDCGAQEAGSSQTASRIFAPNPIATTRRDRAGATECSGQDPDIHRRADRRSRTLPPNNSSASADFLTHLEELAEDVVGDPHSRLVVTSEN